jgi:putative redox protein
MGRTTIATTGIGFRTDVTVNGHRFIADEPVEAKGTDAGPSPYDLLAAALAACKTMTIRFYADREKYPLQSAEATVTHSRLHSKDCANCLSEDGYIHSFDVAIRLTGDLSPEQRKRLVEIAGRCPVSKTLTHEIIVADRLVD